jgi:hypothetical protein
MKKRIIEIGKKIKNNQNIIAGLIKDLAELPESDENRRFHEILSRISLGLYEDEKWLREVLQRYTLHCPEHQPASALEVG